MLLYISHGSDFYPAYFDKPRFRTSTYIPFVRLFVFHIIDLLLAVNFSSVLNKCSNSGISLDAFPSAGSLKLMCDIVQMSSIALRNAWYGIAFTPVW